MIFLFRLPAPRTIRAVITLVMLAIGRSVLRPDDQSTWPVAASARMPAFALTPRGAPVTTIRGPAGAVGAAGAAVAWALAAAAAAEPAATTPAGGREESPA